MGVIYKEDAPEKLLRWPGLSPLVRSRGSRFVEPWVLRERRLLFIHVPKNAGTSISHAVYGRSGQHHSALFYKMVTPELFREADVFAILRDPVARFMSSYWFIRNGGGEEASLNPRFAEMCRDVETPEHLLDLVAALRGDVYLLDHVLRPQSWYVCSRSNISLVPNLFILQEHDDLILKFLTSRGRDAPPHRNATRKGSLTITTALQDRIRHLYSDDYALIEFARRNVVASPKND